MRQAGQVLPFFERGVTLICIDPGDAAAAGCNARDKDVFIAVRVEVRGDGRSAEGRLRGKVRYLELT